MSFFEAAFLGFIQGLTEFLPVSSSGHLAIFQSLMGLNKPTLSFNIFLHMATLLAVGVFFWKDIWNLRKDFKMVAYIVIGTLPAVLVGLVLKDAIEAAFTSLRLVGFGLLITGVLDILSDRKMNQQLAAETAAPKQDTLDEEIHKKKQITPISALLVGIVQSVAILPGISRSGSTVFAGVHLGWNRITAFKFSFMLSIPAILGASVLQMLELRQTGLTDVEPVQFLVGGAAALVTGFLSLVLLKYIMQKAQFQIFGYYCLVIGALTLAMSLR